MRNNPFEVRKPETKTTASLAAKKAAYEAVNHALPVEEVKAAKAPTAFEKLTASLIR